VRNRHLIECVAGWAGERGFRVEPYRLDIAPELADLARRRLPSWAGRIYVGNAIGWAPPRPLDFVRTGLEYVPRRRRRDLVQHLIEHVVAPGGRLIVGTSKVAVPGLPSTPSWQELLTAWGFTLTGGSERRHEPDSRFVYCVVWIDRGP